MEEEEEEEGGCTHDEEVEEEEEGGYHWRETGQDANTMDSCVTTHRLDPSSLNTSFFSSS